MRIGFGYDSHRLVEGRPLILGGVKIDNDRGLQGHSDADALLHAIADAIIGAIAEGDIGRHFPDDDPACKDMSSREILRQIAELAARKGYRVSNVDATIVLEKPKLSIYIPRMAAKIAEILQIPFSHVNVKAKTNEGMGALGRMEGAAAYAVCLVERIKTD